MRSRGLGSRFEAAALALALAAVFVALVSALPDAAGAVVSTIILRH